VDQALASIRQAAETPERHQAELHSWHRAGISTLNTSGAEEALPVLSQALLYAKESGDDQEVLSITRELLQVGAKPVAAWRNAADFLSGRTHAAAASAWLQLGRAHIATKEYENAGDALQHGLELLPELEAELQARLLTEQGYLEALTGSLEKANVTLQHAESAASEIADPAARAKRQTISLRYQSLVANTCYGDVASAERLLLAATERWRENCGSWHPNLATELERLGKFYETAGAPDEAAAALEEATTIQNRTIFTDDKNGLAAIAAATNEALQANDTWKARRRLVRFCAVSESQNGPDSESTQQGHTLLQEISTS
jgi:tetratricopeptide (TPR) repeat protein